MARPSPVSQQIAIAAQADLAATHKLLAETARREHAKVMKADPKPGSFTRWVDGVEGAPESAAKPFGVIEYEYHRLDEVVQFALETLFDKSPVLSGEYRVSHTLFMNGVAVHNLVGWKPGMEVVILNLTPYARKIEQGRMTMRVSGTSRVYQQAQRIVRRRFGNVADISFTYRSPIRAYVALGGRRGGKKASPAKRYAHERETETRVPALVITSR